MQIETKFDIGQEAALVRSLRGRYVAHPCIVHSIHIERDLSIHYELQLPADFLEDSLFGFARLAEHWIFNTLAEAQAACEEKK